jgi:hypothetical protein
MITRTSVALTVALALGAGSPARAQVAARGCRCVPYQQTLSVEVPPTSDWARVRHTATYTVPTWAVFQIDSVSVRATASSQGSMLVFALELSTEVGGVRATHFNTPPLPPAQLVPGGGVSVGILYASDYSAGAASTVTALHAGPATEIRASAVTEFGGTVNGLLEWTLSGRLVTASSGCLSPR